MENSVLSLVPPILALVMVLLTRRVLISLGAGIFVGALMLSYADLPAGSSLWEGILSSITSSIVMIYEIVKGLIITDGALNTWNMYIIFFLFLLGMITSLISLSGGSRAFGEWAMKRVKTRAGAQLVAVILGLIIFIDDYFNSLAVGNVSRPITDRHHVPRAKLAYIIDSTSAPVCVISPISSWGAYIMSIIGGIFVTLQVTGISALGAFLKMIPMNFYAIFTLLLVFASIFFNLNLGKMREHEERAILHHQLVDPSKGKVPGQSDVIESKNGKVRDLVLPIIVLIVATVSFMFVTGANATEGEATLLKIFENTDVSASLLYGGLAALAITLLLAFMKRMPTAQIVGGIGSGIKSMVPAISILFFAWTIIEIIGQVGTGVYLAHLIDGRMNVAFLPVLLFVISSFMSLATGTSWGTFGVMLGIAANIVSVVDMNMLLPAMASVLAGSVFGDHCSPISDTTILSSTGAGSHHIDHVLTQLPYAVTAGLLSVVGYLILGFTGSTLLSLGVALILLALFIYMVKVREKVLLAKTASSEN
ncbi:Na+/H+ antiporter NhaC family protein [Rubeoparvulum massiliense]|uniref:Na+/H+ antiporter NhaC family protein n=1 Tax=Rubeoparvulum massiliense TaxID=1631346 RepID=UPI00065E8C23|nr:Na+/H+ antiporter NhaC family protein [Rubeoparvulum massiliense]